MLNEIQRGLEREVEDEMYAALFRSFAKRSAVGSQFGGWRELISHFHGRRLSSETEDAILRDLFLCHAESHNPLWRTVLTLLFFPFLVSIFSRRRHWTIPPDELWSNLHWGFLRVLLSSDPHSWRPGIVGQVWDRTVLQLRDLCRREWARASREQSLAALDHTEREPKGLTLTDPGFGLLEKRDELEALLARLRRLIAEGAVAEDDVALVLETRLYGASIKAAAWRRGISYDTAAQRRHRAEAVIRRRLNQT